MTACNPFLTVPPAHAVASPFLIYAGRRSLLPRPKLREPIRTRRRKAGQSGKFPPTLPFGPFAPITRYTT